MPPKATPKKDWSAAATEAHRTLLQIDAEIQLEAVDYASLEVHLELVVEARACFNDAICKLEEQQDDIERIRQRRTEFQTLYVKVKGRIMQLMRERDPERAVKAESKGQDGGEASGFKLPKLEIPKFNGNWEDWTSFRDLYRRAMHESKETDIVKFTYLLSLLSGPPKDLVEKVGVSAANYETAWALLLSNYDRPRLIMESHISAIMRLEAAKKDTGEELSRVVNVFQKHYQALLAQGSKEKLGDVLLQFLLRSKLDKESLKAWELSVQQEATGKDGVQKLVDADVGKLIEFVRRRAEVVQCVEQAHPVANPLPERRDQKKKESRSKALVTISTNCPFCKADHAAEKCAKMKTMSVAERRRLIREARRCFVCLETGHMSRSCQKQSCSQCTARHHPLLHESSAAAESMAGSSDVGGRGAVATPTGGATCAAVSCASTVKRAVFLMTALVDAMTKKGEWITLRVLIDPGSHANYITSHAARSLGLPQLKVQRIVSVFGGGSTTASKELTVVLRSHNGDYRTTQTFAIVPKIVDDIPTMASPVRNLPSIPLADPHFYLPGKVDVLLGVQQHFYVTLAGKMEPTKDYPGFLETVFGWIAIGASLANPLTERPPVEASCCNVAVDRTDEIVRRFWDVENVPSVATEMSVEERQIEKHFEKTHRRTEEGRYVVRMPVRPGVQLGHSMEMALRRQLALERRFKREPGLKGQYVDFLRKYEADGHMKLVRGSIEEARNYLPHHAVVTYKTRVVFDASAVKTSGKCLNEALHVGPKIQSDLFAILVRFRKHSIALSADIEAMFRQVLIMEDQRKLQSILWRENDEEPMRTYELQTVTYGTACAPYLASRALKQLFVDESATFSTVTEKSYENFYMDDWLDGAASVKEAIQKRDEMRALLAKGGFNLRKWTSNNLKLVEDLPAEDVGSSVAFDVNECTKTLGLHWWTAADTFGFKNRVATEIVATKRGVYSAIARTFDPLGLIAPILLVGKVLLQKLWSLELDWDEELPDSIQRSWGEFRSSMEELEAIVVPRRLIPFENVHVLELHGFADASESGYGAVVYLRTLSVGGEVAISLVAAKSRVAPLKLMTIPRLELSAALLLSHLMTAVKAALDLPVVKVVMWSDSSVVLQWIRTETRRLKTFVANRVREIRELTHFWQWRHVATKDNPADILSRGATAAALKDCSLWWHGPSYLLGSEVDWPETLMEFVPDDKEIVVVVTKKDNRSDIWSRYSDPNKLVRVIAYCVRFGRKRNVDGVRREMQQGPLLCAEMKKAQIRLLRLLQEEEFPDERKQLLKGRPVHCKSQLLGLAPFLDENGLIRVGGRLGASAELDYEAKHPILLPSNHPFSRALLRAMHVEHLHCGPQALLAAMRRHYWPLRGRGEARLVTRNCITCWRTKPSVHPHLMGELPAARVTVSRPFQFTGVDYAGPFLLKRIYGRSPVLDKGYVAVFVCFATKAIHLELVSDMTTAACLGALQRFIGRRGKPAEIWSDNATTFQGARNELKALGELPEASDAELQEKCRRMGIEWRFIPAYSPHVGGLWEAGVKSFKTHLKREVGVQHLTFEEMATLLAQVEAVLNSRPLTPLSDDPNDITALTPGHFLIGAPLTSVPDADRGDINLNRLDRWQRVQQIKLRIWKRWKDDYLNTLQQRSKWSKLHPNLTVGSLVLVKDDNDPPLKWPLARVIGLSTGDDGVVRMVRLKMWNGTKNVETTRTVRKVCPLPVLEDDSSSGGRMLDVPTKE